MKDNKALYDTIGIGYNTTRQADPYITERLFQLLSPQTNGTYLDIGCGTGNYTIALANKGINFYGVEPSEKMLGIARSKNTQVNWTLGRSENIEVNDKFFDGAIATLTVHHWTDIKKAFTEIYRVLKENAKIIFFTATPEQMKGYWLNHYFPKMLDDSIVQMPSFETIKEAATNAGFEIIGTEKYYISDDLKDLFLYAGKNKPELYLDAEIRKGISSFSALANADEVEEGLSKLRDDMELGRFGDIKAKFNNDSGDYLFIIAQKC
jgi:ubiquinone/menaquinone biosynthesis C-methylase UbiE